MSFPISEFPSVNTPSMCTPRDELDIWPPYIIRSLTLALCLWELSLTPYPSTNMPPSRRAKPAVTTEDSGDYVFFWKTPVSMDGHHNGTPGHPPSKPQSRSTRTGGDGQLPDRRTLAKSASILQQVCRSQSYCYLGRLNAIGEETGKNFGEETWRKERERIVLEGSLLKFRQNEELKQYLFETGDKTIVEASPGDKRGRGGGVEGTLQQDKIGSQLLG
jgi:hypothetical protein